MVLETKQTTVAYRCPHCGSGVMSAINPFVLKGSMVRLKCECGKSFLEVQPAAGGKLHLSVPCMLCPTPHHFTVSEAIFYGQAFKQHGSRRNKRLFKDTRCKRCRLEGC